MARAKFWGYSLLRIVSVPWSAAQNTVSITVSAGPAASSSGNSGVPAQTAFPTMPWVPDPLVPGALEGDGALHAGHGAQLVEGEGRRTLDQSVNAERQSAA